MSSRTDSIGLTTVSTGNEELDLRLGGGLPFPAIVVIEGDNGTGKTALCCQFVYGLTSNGKKALYITTENSIKGLLDQARNINIDLITPYIKGLLTLVPAHLEGIKWGKRGVRELTELLMEFIRVRSKGFDTVILDSMTLLLNYVSANQLYDLITVFRRVVKEGKLAIVTLHSKVVKEEVMKVLIASSDVYLRLFLTELGGRAVKAMNIIKIRGAPTLAETVIAFDVDPAFGIKVVPLAIAKV